MMRLPPPPTPPSLPPIYRSELANRAVRDSYDAEFRRYQRERKEWHDRMTRTATRLKWLGHICLALAILFGSFSVALLADIIKL